MDKQKLIARLTKYIDLDRIFLFDYPFDNENRLHLLLVMNPISGISPKVMKPVIQLCLADTPEMSFDIIPFGEWQHYIHTGSVYYTFASLPEHELYASPGKKNKKKLHQEVNAVIRSSVQVFETLKCSAVEFMEGNSKYEKQENYHLATFMLHQALEFHLKILQYAVSAKNNQVHSIKSIIKGLTSCFPALQSVFPRTDERAVEMLRVLDNSFRYVKQQKDLDITREQFISLKEKCEWLINEINNLIHKLMYGLIAFRDQKAFQTTSGTLNDNSEKTPVNEGKEKPVYLVCEDFSSYPFPKPYKVDIQHILDNIQEKHHPEQIMLINYRTGEFSHQSFFVSTNTQEKEPLAKFYLFVLLRKRCNHSHQDITKGCTKAMVLFFDLNYVRQKLQQGSQFMTSVWQNATVIRRQPAFDPIRQTKPIDWKAKFEKARDLWKKTKNAIEGLVRLSDHIANDQTDLGNLICGHLLEKGLKCYLYCTIGYFPKNASLAWLIDYSAMANMQLIQFFMPRNADEELVNKCLIHYKKIWQDNVCADAPNPSKYPYWKKTKEIAQFFEEQCSKALQDMENKTLVAMEKENTAH